MKLLFKLNNSLFLLCFYLLSSKVFAKDVVETQDLVPNNLKPDQNQGVGKPNNLGNVKPASGQGSVKNKPDSVKKVEAKKSGDKKVEVKKSEDKKVEAKKSEDKKVEAKKSEKPDKKVEEGPQRAVEKVADFSKKPGKELTPEQKRLKALKEHDAEKGKFLRPTRKTLKHTPMRKFIGHAGIKELCEKYLGMRYAKKTEFKFKPAAFTNPMDAPHYTRREDSKRYYDDLSAKYGKDIRESKLAPVYVKWIDEKLGYALFAEKKIRKGDFIGEYTGLVKPSNEVFDTSWVWTYPAGFYKRVEEGKAKAKNVTEDKKLAKSKSITAEKKLEKTKNITEEKKLAKSKNVAKEKKVKSPRKKFPKISLDAKLIGNAMRFVNDGDNPNAKVLQVYEGGHWHIVYAATRTIKPGEQVTVSYGHGYWAHSRKGKKQKN